MTNMSDAGTPRVKFVASNAAGLPVKRKQVQQACVSCKKRKKRCSHAPDSSATHHLDANDGQDHRVGGAENGRSSSSPAPPSFALASKNGISNSAGLPPSIIADAGDPDQDVSDAASQLLHFSHQRLTANTTPEEQQLDDDSASPSFIGDTNPEGVLIAAVMANISREAAPPSTSLGIWGHRRFRGTPGDTNSPRTAEDAERVFDDAQREFARVLAAEVLPADNAWDALRAIYLRKIHPIFPVFPREKLLRLSPFGHEQGIEPLIKASVCLAAASDPEAAPHLLIRVQEGHGPTPGPDDTITNGNRTEPSPVAQRAGFTTSYRRVTYTKYRFKLYKFIRAAAQDFDPDDPGLFHYIRALTLTYLFCQPTTAKERHELAVLFAAAVDLVQTHGLHLGGLGSSPLARNIRPPRTSNGGATTAATEEEAKGGIGDKRAGSEKPADRRHAELTRLFMCVYAMDRMNSAFNGQPVLLHDRDIQWMAGMRDDPGAWNQPPSFTLFMTLVFLLDDVIELYRPCPREERVDPPIFEHLVLMAGAHGEPLHVLATLELFYHAISVLSVRMHHSDFPHQEPLLPGGKPPPAPRADFKYMPSLLLNPRRSLSADRILLVAGTHALCPLPIVSYALSLALSVEYRKWRFSQIPMFRARGRANFERILGLLRRHAEVFSNAGASCRLGQMVVEQMRKAEAKVKRQCREAGGSERTVAPTGKTSAVQNGALGRGPVPGLVGESKMTNGEIHAGGTLPSQRQTAPDGSVSGPFAPMSDRPDLNETQARISISADPDGTPRSTMAPFVPTVPSHFAPPPPHQPDTPMSNTAPPHSHPAATPGSALPDAPPSFVPFALPGPGGGGGVYPLDFAGMHGGGGAGDVGGAGGDMTGYDLFPLFEEAFPTSDVDMSFFNNLDPTCPLEWTSALASFETGRPGPGPGPGPG